MADDPWPEKPADVCFDYEQLSIRGIVHFQARHGDQGQAAFEHSLQVRPDEFANREMLVSLYLAKNCAERARDILENELRRATDVRLPRPTTSA